MQIPSVRGRLVSAVLLSLVLLHAGCQSCPSKGPNDIYTALAFGIAKKGQVLELRAKCRSGGHVIGAGYWSDHLGHPEFNEFNFGKNCRHNLVTVLGSYPSSDGKEWIVRFLCHDDVDKCNDDAPVGEVMVSVYVYCAKPPLAQHLGVASAEESVSDPNGSTAIANAPEGAVVTGGGFHMTYVGGLPVSNQNVYVRASGPDVNGGIATGWRAVRDAPWYPPNQRRITAHVVFARSGLNHGRIIQSFANTTQYLWGPYWSDMPVQSDEFCTGAGFEFRNAGPLSGAIIHGIVENRTLPGFAGWRVYGYNGEQSPKYGPQTSAAIEFKAIAIKSPYPRLCVQIDDPENKTIVGLGPADPTDKSATITFKARAFVGSNPLPGSSIQWTVDGQPHGTGGTLVTALTLGQQVPHSQRFNKAFRIRARVTDSGRTASDSIEVRVLNARIE